MLKDLKSKDAFTEYKALTAEQLSEVNSRATCQKNVPNQSTKLVSCLPVKRTVGILKS